MKKPILDRYSRTEDGRVIVDITTSRVADLYNNFDKTTTFAKKELDEDLVGYLVDSVKEIGKEAFIIRFHFSEAADTNLQTRVKTSLHNYFEYLRELEFRSLYSMFRTSSLFLVVGGIILFLSVWANSSLPTDANVISRVFAEGLTIAAWVAMWQAVASFLVNWLPHRRNITLFDRLAGATVEFES